MTNVAKIFDVAAGDSGDAFPQSESDVGPVKGVQRLSIGLVSANEAIAGRIDVDEFGGQLCNLLS